MQKFKIIVSYDGTNYQGWQSQPHKKTIANFLQDSFRKVFGKSIKILGASRTDSGVHALGQVAQFKTDLKIDEKSMMIGWNNILPDDILIRALQKVDDSFNCLSGVKQKTYYYHLFLSRPLPFIARYGWFYGCINIVDWEKFNKALQLFIGEHDFRSFCKVEDSSISTIRKIDSINLNTLSRFNCIQIVIKGKGFLRFQIRRMIGYALDVAIRPNLSVDYLKNILDNPSPIQTLLKAEAKGLFLRKIIYENNSEKGEE